VTSLPWFASLGLVLAIVFVALLIIGWLLAPRPETQEDKRQKLLGVYTVDGRRPANASVEDTSNGAAGGLVALSQRFVDRRGTAASIAVSLERAGSRLRPGEWVVLRVCTVLAVAAVVSVLTRNVLVGVIAGVVLGWFGTWLWLRHKQTRRARAFADSLPDTLQLVASSLRTGFSLPQALDAAQQDGVQPMAAELGRALAAARIGAPLEDELDQIAERTSSEDWRWAVMAIRIQRTVGGNLAEVLMTTVRTLRERAATRRQVRTLSAEGRLSAYILIGLPIMVAGVLLLFRRQYLHPLWTTTPGVVMVAGALLLMGVGSLWMRKVVTVEV
jgi:Flp pilus assembly protein TadB